ncbi:MAG: DnaD domain protein [Chloroflexi bacterium]|nr:DnaD domain protein [Chloroflexota bacterium]MDL1882408.1 DnaD domain protein [Anaerolineae bacterium CFX8]
MQKFNGFPPGKVRMVEMPAPFFAELLPLVDDLAELKVILFCFWALPQKDERFRYLRRQDFADSPDLMRGLAAADPDADPDDTLDAALGRAVERGALLCADVTAENGRETLYFANTALGRTAVQQVQQGRWKPFDTVNPVEILPERPNIYRLYEENIGPLTAMIADALKDAEKDYPSHWIEEAIREAVENNKRSWRYIQRILKRWESEGKSREIAGQYPEQDGQSYVTGELSRFIKH